MYSNGQQYNYAYDPNQYQYQQPMYNAPPPPPQQYYQYEPDPIYQSYSSDPYYGTQVAYEAYPPPPQESSYSYGKRKALLIGINYFGSRNQLSGCINDTQNMYNFLVQRYGYSPDDIVRLTDDQANPVCVPTRYNMLRAMSWLVKDVQPGDHLFLHYSGHGGQTPDLDGDEEDGMDDVIYPVDFETQGFIVDDLMHDIMVRPLMQGVTFTALFDSCHSGTVLDLPFTYSTKGVIKEPNMWKNIGSSGLGAAMAYATGNTSDLLGSLRSIGNTVGGGNNGYDRQRVIQMKFSPADIIMLSGSKDNQTSADTFEDGQNIGAMSHAFIKVMSYQPQQSYLSLLQNIRAELMNKYSQRPQLSTSHPIDINAAFNI
ncbi:caspase family protein NDAI_0E02470 [Naumovozyma dairenensis CBS 421]|uniref:Metacaspase-1 n=1 Tax=Naumovozyma dairenensis (strain ATCC 10597 / BCRC 20456 / CBS 421 / NBRC 0211 / NRRL Y-12639) TaxID=1071378 RepID=G0WBE4_NAUDC|nr:hypothetical protein NDAI_0E02470 [Naumovozyma dairenensis CBS 421]CCD25064.1 hypothetical protein NDAI_0E02470 [Naumovozyma dairenensis CBS 421]